MSTEPDVAKAALTLHEAETCDRAPDGGACLNCVRRARDRLDELVSGMEEMNDE